LTQKILTFDELAIKTAELKESNKKIVWTNGCFDLLHIGHIDYLKEAKAQGDVLIVGINNDESIRELKGDDRPVVPATERAELLAALTFVDFVTVFPKISPLTYLEALCPHVYVKGGDYTVDTINQDERKVVESYGGKITLIPLKYRQSSTKIISKIRGHHETIPSE
jgi:rfaE bifunctional protein nucleotidyltransferase chain/domain